MSVNTNMPSKNEEIAMTEGPASDGKGTGANEEKLADLRVWEFHYDLYGSDANKIESSKQGPPVLCLEGERGVLIALQEALRNKVAGDDFSITIPHGKAYGRHYPNRVTRLSRKKIDGGKAQTFHVGQIISVQGTQGPSPATVVKVGKFNLDVDLNHPLAGVDLTFDVNVVAVRNATQIEVMQGFASGEPAT